MHGHRRQGRLALHPRDDTPSPSGSTPTAGRRLPHRPTHKGQDPVVVLDADDTTLWTYDMEDGAMHFIFDPVLQNEWVQPSGSRPLPDGGADQGGRRGGLHAGRTHRSQRRPEGGDPRQPREGRLHRVHPANYYTKWTGKGTSPAARYITCAAVSCTTIEYKSQTAQARRPGGQRHRIVANLGDQFSDLIGGYADRPVKLPNPTYYLP